MNDFDCWVYLDGPEPERLCQFLDAIRELPPLLPEDEARMDRRVMAALDAALGFVDAPALAPPAPQRAASPPAPLLPAPLPLSAPAPFAPQPPSAGMPPPLGSGSPSASPAVSIPVYPLPPPPPPPPPQPLPQVVRPPAALATTAPMHPHAALPSPAAAVHFPPDAPVRPRAAHTLNSEVRPDLRLKTTTPLGDDSLPKAIAAIPFLGSTLGTGTVPVPRMPIEAYASFRAELAYWPAIPDFVRTRYHILHEAAHRALDEHWSQHFAEHPEDRPAYRAAFISWTETLTARCPK